MINLIKSIVNTKDDVVFVGSTYLWYLNLIKKANDIDIVVNNLNGLEVFGEIITWETTSPMSLSGKRAHIKRDDYSIDIFIEPVLPKFNIIDGIKFITIEDNKLFIDSLIELTEGEFKNRMIDKKRLLDSII
jgi:hypothetical protein